MRGLFSMGVLDVMMENGLWLDGAIGVSAGAAFGCNYKSRQAGRVIRYNKRFSHEWRYCSFRSLLRTGDLYGASFCYEEVPQRLDPFDYEAYARNPMPFWVVCTDVDTGEAVYHRCDRVEGGEMDWIRASASMPLAAHPVILDGKRLLDGGIADSIPLRQFESMGYERNVVILTQPAGYEKQPVNRALLWALRGMPKVTRAMERRHEVYNQTIAYIARQEAAGVALVIRPPEKLRIRHIEHDADNMQRVYDLGRAEGQKRLDELRAFLQRT